jgi:hypothetical protein
VMQKNSDSEPSRNCSVSVSCMDSLIICGGTQYSLSGFSCNIRNVRSRVCSDEKLHSRSMCLNMEDNG